MAPQRSPCYVDSVMGQAKQKQMDRQRVIAEHPWCIYCGAPARTTDHCPPKCVFFKRNWPEGYEFPCCEPCNSGARLDDQAVALLFRSRLDGFASQIEHEEYLKLIRGVTNNQNDLYRELRESTRNEQRRHLRQQFGVELGDQLRREGWGAVALGPLSRAIMRRFIERLARALYFKHNGAPFEGLVYGFPFNPVTSDFKDKDFERMLAFSPLAAIPVRSGKSLKDQFIYAFNHNAEYGVLHAVVQFGDQFVFRLLAMRMELALKLEEKDRNEGRELPTEWRFECVLGQSPATA